MEIDTIFICNFFDPDLRIEIFFEREGSADQNDVSFEIKVKAPAVK